MAVTVSIEFTDAQWALILEHFPKRESSDGTYPEALTSEIIAAYLLDDVKNTTTLEIQAKAATEQQDAFDV